MQEGINHMNKKRLPSWLYALEYGLEEKISMLIMVLIAVFMGM